MSNLNASAVPQKGGGLGFLCAVIWGQHERLDFITERRWSELLEKKKKTIWLSSFREQPNYIFFVNY